MKKPVYIFLVLLCPIFVFSQKVEIGGKVKISIMEEQNTSDSLVVWLPDSTIARRHVSSLPKELPANPTAGDMLYFDGTNWQLLSQGTDGQTLQLNSGMPSWTDCNLSLGQFYKGGYIFYLDATGCHGLVVAPGDQNTGAEWGCSGDEIGGTSSALGTGQSNTDTIVNGCAEAGIAARLCDDLVYGGYDDWLLPSKDELNLMWENLADPDGNNNNSGTGDSNNIGGFGSVHYWSSTEDDSDFAWRQDLGNGNQGSDVKGHNYGVRAVRAF